MSNILDDILANQLAIMSHFQISPVAQIMSHFQISPVALPEITTSVVNTETVAEVVVLDDPYAGVDKDGVVWD